MRRHYRTHIKIDRSGAGLDPPEVIIANALRKKFKGAGRSVLVAVGGPGGIGKSTFAEKLKDKLVSAVVLALDNYKKSREERSGKNLYGPHPDANEIELIISHLEALRRGEGIERPVYCREKGKINSTQKFEPAEFVIVEGEISTYREFHHLVDFSIFIDSHWKTQLNTRISRDIEERGYTPKKAIAAFLYSNLHEFTEYGEESRKWADVHIHCYEDYELVIDAVCSKNFSFIVDEVSSNLAEVMNDLPSEKSVFKAT
jgi:uridine kinase